MCLSYPFPTSYLVEHAASFSVFACSPTKALWSEVSRIKNIFQPHEKCRTFQWLVIITLSQTFYTKVNDLFVRRSFSYPLCVSVWIYWCLCIYIFLNIFLLRKPRRNVKILFWFEGFVWDFSLFSFTFYFEKRIRATSSVLSFYLQSLENGNLSFLCMQSFSVCVCVCDGHMYASIRQPLLLKQTEKFHTSPV